MTNYEKVQAFNEHFKCYQGVPGSIPSTDQMMFHTRLIMEELSELIKAMQMQDYVAMAKELADLLYTVYDLGGASGLPVDDVFDAVHKSNMTKDDERDAGNKIVKGDNYVPPDIGKVLDLALRRKK